MRKIVFSIISLALSVCCLVASIYAWFTGNIQINNIIITTGNVDVSASLYKGADFDLDGSLDTDDNGIDIYALTEELNVALANPGDTVSYRLKITNTGDYNGILAVGLNFEGSLQNVLSLTVWLENSEGVRQYAVQDILANDLNEINDLNQIYTSVLSGVPLARYGECNLFFSINFVAPGTDLSTFQNNTFSMTVCVVLEQKEI